MSSFPDTQLSLILRLPIGRESTVDEAAWHEFAELYSPFIYQFARRRGLQDADAHDLTQRVLTSVARSVDRWQPQAAPDSSSRFRNWLFTIARNHLLNSLRTRQRYPVISGDSALQTISGPESDSAALANDYRHDVFQWAAVQVEKQVNASTWQAFWLTTVGGRDCAEVARETNQSLASVYAARSRVMARVKQVVQSFLADEADPTAAEVSE